MLEESLYPVYNRFSHAIHRLKATISKNSWAIFFQNLTIEKFLQSNHSTPFLGVSLRGLVSLGEGYEEQEYEPSYESLNCLRKLSAYHHVGKDESKYYFNTRIYKELKYKILEIEDLYKEKYKTECYKDDFQEQIDVLALELETKIYYLKDSELLDLEDKADFLDDAKTSLIQTLQEHKRNGINDDTKEMQHHVQQLFKQIKEIEQSIKVKKEELTKLHFSDIEFKINKLKELIYQENKKAFDIVSKIALLSIELDKEVSLRLDKTYFEIEAKLWYIKKEIQEYNKKAHIDDVRKITLDLIDKIRGILAIELDETLNYEHLKIGLQEVLDKTLQDAYKYEKTYDHYLNPTNNPELE